MLSKCQKGFLPHDGVFELNYILQRRLDIARSGGIDLCAALMDFNNAFGSVLHQALLDALRGACAGSKSAEVIGDWYTDNSTCILAAEGTTDPIPILAGLLHGGGSDPKILAYTDEPTPPASTPRRLPQRIDRIETLAASLGLALKPSKCVSFHMVGSTPVGMRPTEFRVSGVPILVLPDFEPQRYLVHPIDFRIPSGSGSVVESAIAQARAIMSSMLAPWQCLDALRTFLYPVFYFPMRCGVLSTTDLRRLDDAIRPLVKRTLYLPANAPTNYIYGSSSGGSVGIPVAAKLSDLCHIDSGFKLLTSPDTELRQMALDDAYAIATARLGWEVTRAELEAYVGGSLGDGFRVPATQLRSVWGNARKASRCYNVTVTLDPGGVRLTYGGATITPQHRCRVMRTLREVLATERDRALHDLPNQGKVLACMAADRASSHFMWTGAFTSFADWRFVHRARLNLLPLNGARMWGAPDRDQRHRVCGYLRETLPHVVCHHMPRSALYQARRNAIVDRVRTAASREFTAALKNQAVRDTGLRPDLVLVRGEEAIVIDVTCPFENTPHAFENARNAKLAHYEPVAAFLPRRYQRVTVALVDAVHGTGAGEPFAEIVEELYHAKTICVVAADGTMEPITIGTGLHQGCPLSSLLLNLVVDAIIRAVQGGGRQHNILAYADDLTLLAGDPAPLAPP
ncbi:uncharacterized protein LOC142765890 [Rhipicephalus microplus]|uniref:uncharacterized protein LOC142765890 n=1 Tax=Rhipicephalus microplus TaxID=6941 RepID=UPI003F6CC033